MNNVVLITGASSGIGKATAKMLAQGGYRVYAAARRIEKMNDLKADGVHVIRMDVTDDQSIVTGVEEIVTIEGKVDILINNAGFGQYGSVEDILLFKPNVRCFMQKRLTLYLIEGLMKKNELQYNILYSCTDEKERGSENLVSEHVITFILSGRIQLYVNQVLVEYKAGQMALLRKNLLLRSFKYPADDGQPFQSLNVFLAQESLRKFSATHNVVATGVYNEGPIFDLSDDIFIKGYFDSLVPYFNTDVPLTEHLADLKTYEAIELVLRHKKLQNLLLDFAVPHKTDLEAFMNQNYAYNIPMSKFALLTGRSLATFKRDFKKIFHNSPEKWIMQKRLEAAHFLIAQKRQPPSAVFQDVGFENFSHFSTAFKKKFGYNASSLVGP